jgi:DNA topoisomerase-3
VVKAEIAEEQFTAKGLVITQRNYLEVYTYDRWSDTEIPAFTQNERIPSESLVMTQGSTQAPPLLSEADLITLMDKSGIGTDATIHDHIKTIQEREYVTKDPNGRFMPTTLGFALIEGFDSMGFGFNISMSKPYLRRQVVYSFVGPLAQVGVFDAIVLSRRWKRT